jgi:hypothetical protein
MVQSLTNCRPISLGCMQCQLLVGYIHYDLPTQKLVKRGASRAADIISFKELRLGLISLTYISTPSRRRSLPAAVLNLDAIPRTATLAPHKQYGEQAPSGFHRGSVFWT